MALPLIVIALEYLGLLPGSLLLPCGVGVILLTFVLTERISDHFVDGLEALATRYRIPQTVMGASVAAIGSSMPELATHVNAVASGNTEIGIGTIVGSAIFNLCIIIGASAWIRRCNFTREVIYRDGLFYLLSVLLLLFLLVGDGFVLNWWEPFVLFGFYLVYLGYLFHDARKGELTESIEPTELTEPSEPSEPNEHKEPTEASDQARPTDPTELPLPMTLLFVGGGVAAILMLGSYIVWAALVITGELGWNESIFALIIIAIGTSIPDLFTSIQAARKGIGDLAVANAIGSNTFDICVAIGLPLMLLQLWGLTSTEVEGALGASIVYLLGTLVVTMALLRHGWTIGRRKALILMVMYMTFIPVLLLENQGHLPSWGG